MEVGDESIAACAHNINKDDNKKMKTTNNDCVGIRGNNKRFGRGETHESKQRRLYIYQRAIALVTHSNWLFWAVIRCANMHLRKILSI